MAKLLRGGVINEDGTAFTTWYTQYISPWKYRRIKEGRHNTACTQIKHNITSYLNETVPYKTDTTFCKYKLGRNK